MNLNKIKVSIIVPVWNCEKYLEKCLESLVNQTLSDIEIICINDGSTDGSRQIMERYAQSYSNILIIHQKNSGLSAARNTGLNVAKGEYIYFLDSDDYIEEFALEEMYKLSNEYGLDVLYFDGQSIFETEELRQKHSNYINCYQRDKSYGLYDYGRELFYHMVEGGEYQVQASLQFISHHYIKKLNLRFYEDILYEDNFFNLQCILQAGRVLHVNTCYFNRLIREKSIITSELSFHNFHSYFLCYQQMLLFANSLEENDRVLTSVAKIIEHIYWRTKNTFETLSVDEKGKLSSLSPTKQLAIRNSNIINKIQYDRFQFPAFLIEKKNNIILYGAGDVGRTLFKQNQMFKHTNIVMWVDKNYKMLYESGFPVTGPQKIQEIDFDYILIAVVDSNVYLAIKDFLIKMGISDEKILWYGDKYEFIEQINYYRESIKLWKGIAKEEKNRRFFLFNTPEHGNLGDHAIVNAQNSFLTHYFPDIRVIEIPNPKWIQLKDEIIELINENDIIFINGGGSLGDLWESSRIIKEVISKFPKSIKIVFPQTIYYLNVKEGLEKDKSFFSIIDNLYIFTREGFSYKFILNHGLKDNSRCFLFPDMVTFMDESKGNSTTSRKNILLCLRSDKEKVLTDEGEVHLQEVLSRSNISVIKTDMHIHREILSDKRDGFLETKYDEFRSAKLVITDRLHGMLFAAITGTPCIAVNNLTKKVEGVYQWIKYLDYIVFTDIQDINEVMVEKMLSIRSTKYNNQPLMKEFDRMAQIIMKIISEGM